MKILIAGKSSDIAQWQQAFAALPGVETETFDPADGLAVFDEREAASRVESRIAATGADAVCAACGLEYRGAVSAAALGSGTHVISETPIAETDTERRLIIESAENSGKLFMAACPPLFRPGMLRLITLIFKGAIGKVRSVNVTSYDDRNDGGDTARFEYSVEAYNSIAKQFGDLICLAGRISGVKFNTVGTNDPKPNESGSAAVSLIGDGVGAELRMHRHDKSDTRLADELSKSLIDVPANASFISEIRIEGANGEADYFIVNDNELFILKSGGKIRRASMPLKDWRATCAESFADFVSRGINPFLDARAAAEAEALAVKSMDHLREIHYSERKRKMSDVRPANLPQTLKPIEDDSPLPKLLMSYEDYLNGYSRTIGESFRIKLFDTPPANKKMCNMKKFTHLSVPTLAGVARRHGCVVETDDLTKFALREGPLTADEIKAVWGIEFDDSRPAVSSETLRAAARKAADSLDLSGADLIGFSFNELTHTGFTLELCREVKRRVSTPVVFGGLFEFGNDEMESAADFAIRGDGEIPLLLLVQHLKGELPIENIPGLSFPDTGGSGGGARETFTCDIRVRGVPFYNPEVSALYARNGITLYPYMSINGCPHKCAFCASSFYGRRGMLEPSETLDQLRRIVEETGARHFYFLNNLLNINKRWMNEFLDGLIEGGPRIQWSDSACFHGIDADTAQKMYQAGCRKLTWGIDASSERMMKLINKPAQSFDRIESILKTTRSAGIRNEVNLIVGLPYETLDDLDCAFRFLERNSELISIVNCAAFYYSEGSPYFWTPEKFGLIKKGNTFDEKDGLKWAAKSEYIKEAYRKAREFLNEYDKEHYWNEYHFMY